MRDGWRTVRLGEAAGTVSPNGIAGSGERYVGLEHIDSGSPWVTRWADTKDVLSASTPFVDGDVLFSKLRPYLRKVVVADFAGRCTNEALVYRTGSDELEQSYLALVLQSEAAIAHAVASSVGSRMPRTSIKLMSSFEFGLPSLGEQRRIVDLIGALDNVIAAREGVNARIRRLLCAVSDALPGETEELDRLLLAIEGGRSPAGVERQPNSGERAVLKVSAIGPDGFDPTEVKVVPPDVYLPPHSAVSADDVLMVRANGVLNRVGVVCWVPEDYPQLHLCDKTLRLVPNTSLLNSTWMTAALSSRDARKQIESLTTGSHMRNIGQTAIRKVRIPAPPLSVQEEYAEVITILNKNLELGAETLRQLRGVRSELLTGLLAGEHEIPESYDELIEEDVA